jgi:hypothetical protein
LCIAFDVTHQKIELGDLNVETQDEHSLWEAS